MRRLNDRAFEILRAEVEKCAAAESLAGEVYRMMVIKRLEKLRSQNGTFASIEEIRNAVKDEFPNFSEKALKAAVKANQPPGLFSKIMFAGSFLGAGAGIIWLLNLPFPMIRWPVAKTMPILLLPSFISMDHNYRQAIALVEQSDQLVNKATAAADFDLGETKAKQAQKHLDALPVWFLGYYPKTYCSFFGCTWRFTVDEFEAARKNIGRMDAQIFQQRNAFTQLAEVEQSLTTAKQEYQQAKTAADRQKASIKWQSAIDRLNQIPPETLAGETAKKKLQAAERDFQAMGGVATGSVRSDNLIEAAKEFALTAAVASQKAPHTAESWQKTADLWQEAIERLSQITFDNPGYLDAQTKLAEYQKNLGTTQIRLKAERESVEAFNRAKNLFANFQSNLNSTSQNPGYALGQLQEIINQLESVKPGTTVYPEAQKWLQSARKKQQEWQKN
jgi:tetratricopeptide (TPR) repeat protein